MNRRLVMLAVTLVLFVGALFVLWKGQKTTSQGSQPSRTTAQEIFNQVTALKKNNEILKARDLCQAILRQYPDYEGIEAAQKDLEEMNMKIITSNIQAPGALMVQVQPGDSLNKIAKKYNTTVELIKKRNSLAGDTIRAGQQLSIWSGNFNVYVDKSQNILMLKDADRVVKVYSVSTGANNSTPIGRFTVTSKLVDPVWFKSGAVIPPESPQNVLGSRWMGFDLQGYGIHGTTEPNNLGKQVTAGCVRMKNEEVEELYDLLPLSTKVEIVD